MADIVYVPDAQPSTKYVVYRLDGSHEIADCVQAGGITYTPPQSRLVETKTVLLPTGVAEYGTDAELLTTIQRYVRRWFKLSSDAWAPVIATFVFMTWVFDRFEAVPYLRALGDYASGKSRLLQVVGHLVYRGIFAGGATSASPVFRLIDRYKGTVILDEADFRHSDMRSDLIKILTCGYMKGFPVLRCEKTRGPGGETFDPQDYDVFGPKVLAAREPFDDPALESRCITYPAPVFPDTAVADVSLTFGDQAKQEAQQLRNKLLLWRFRRYREMSVDPYARLDEVELRVQQIFGPLLAVFDDPALRATIIDQAHAVAVAFREERRDRVEGQIVEALVQLRGDARREGFWKVTDITRCVNFNVPERHHVNEKTVGRRMKALLGYPSQRHPQSSRAVYAYSEDAVKRLARLYRIPLRRPVLPKDRPE
jgi:hypothetical protein